MTNPPPDRGLTWKTFGVLMLGALVGALAVVPYSVALLATSLPPGGAPPLPVLLAASVVQTMVLTGIAAAIGVWLGPRVGLGAPMLRAWLAGDPEAPRQFLASLPLAAGLGVAASLVIVALDVVVFAPSLRALQPSAAEPLQPAVWQGLLASLYGAIDEEILLRLGLITLLVWLAAKLLHTDRPGPAIMWTANILAAVIFGLGHLPATAALFPLTAIVIVRAVVLNGLAGVVFGWLYWRRGILVAMASHFCADLVLHVVAPLIISPR